MRCRRTLNADYAYIFDTLNCLFIVPTSDMNIFCILDEARATSQLTISTYHNDKDLSKNVNYVYRCYSNKMITICVSGFMFRQDKLPNRVHAYCAHKL